MKIFDESKTPIESVAARGCCRSKKEAKETGLQMRQYGEEGKASSCSGKRACDV